MVHRKHETELNMKISLINMMMVNYMMLLLCWVRCFFYSLSVDHQLYITVLVSEVEDHIAQVHQTIIISAQWDCLGTNQIDFDNSVASSGCCEIKYNKIIALKTSPITHNANNKSAPLASTLFI